MLAPNRASFSWVLSFPRYERRRLHQVRLSAEFIQFQYLLARYVRSHWKFKFTLNIWLNEVEMLAPFPTRSMSFLLCRNERSSILFYPCTNIFKRVLMFASQWSLSSGRRCWAIFYQRVCSAASQSITVPRYGCNWRASCIMFTIAASQVPNWSE